IWDIATGNELHTLAGHQDAISCLMVKDGILFSGSYDSRIKIWDIESGTELKTLSNESPVYSLTVKDEMLFSSSRDSKIKIWNFNPVNNHRNG
ncbi:MAG: hypothetical protein JSR57_11570, partial [Verrucomicrobia bacterium]|nr:hypothetical protein [Verrucomicrobiota bacterium]